MKQNENGEYERDYTTDENGNKTYKSITFKYKTITSMRKENIKTKSGRTTITMFNVMGDQNATNLFEFLANPKVTTNVEWSHNKVGTESSQKNIVGTSNLEDGTYQADYLRSEGYIIQENIHSHPRGTGPSSADKYIARLIYETNKKAYFMIYKGSGIYQYYVPDEK